MFHITIFSLRFVFIEIFQKGVCSVSELNKKMRQILNLIRSNTLLNPTFSDNKANLKILNKRELGEWIPAEILLLILPKR